MTNRNHPLIAAAAVLAIVALWAGPPTAQAGTATWTGGNGADWNVSGNWSGPTTPPGATDEARFVQGSGGSSVNLLGQSETIGSLTATYAGNSNGFEIKSTGGHAVILNGGPVSLTHPSKKDKKLQISAKLSGTTSGLTVNPQPYSPDRESWSGVRLTNDANDFVGDITVNGGLLAGIKDARLGNVNNDILVTNGGVLFVSNSEGTWNPNAGRTITIGAGGGTMHGHGGNFSINDANQLAGSGPLSVRANYWGTTLTVSQAQNFAGGFDVYRGGKRHARLVATAAGAMGTGASVVAGDNGSIKYTWGAQSIGGAADGGAAGVMATNNGEINLQGTWSGSKDRFVVEAYGHIHGDSAQLGAVTRVAGFTPYASQTGPEVILADGAVVTHDTVSASSIANLGSGADLIYGLGTTFNNAAFTLNIGDGTPWRGIARRNGGDGDTHITFSKGTVSIDTSGGFSEIQITELTQLYSESGKFKIGSGADCQSFVLASGSTNKVVARVTRTSGYGQLWLDTTNPNFSNAISKFAVDYSANLISRRAAALGTDLDILHGGYVQVYNNATTVKDMAYSGAARLALDQNGTTTSLTADSLTRGHKGLLMVVAHGGTGALGSNEKFLVTGHAVGAVAPTVIAASADLKYNDLLDYDAADGFKVAAYDVTSGINAAVAGDRVKVSSSQTLTADRSMLALVTKEDLYCSGGGTGTYTVHLGKESGGGQAAQAALLLNYPGGVDIRANVDFGSSEGILVEGVHTGWSNDVNVYGGLQGAGGLTIYGASSFNHVIYLRGTNTLTGPVTLLNGHLESYSGTGLADGCTLEVMRGATFQMRINDTVAGLTGGGLVQSSNGSRAFTVRTIGVGDSYSFGGTIADGAGTLSLVKDGPGTQILTGENTYTGTTTVQGGRLQVDGSLAAGSAVTVLVGGELCGTGTVHGPVTVTGGAVAPGASAGTLTLAGGATFDGSTYLWELDALLDSATGTPGVDWDLVDMAGSVLTATDPVIDIAGIDPDDDPFWAETHAWRILVNARDLAVTGGSVIGYDEAFGMFDVETGQDSGGLYLDLLWEPAEPADVIPEPATMALLAAGGLGVLLRRRRRS